MIKDRFIVVVKDDVVSCWETIESARAHAGAEAKQGSIAMVFELRGIANPEASWVELPA